MNILNNRIRAVVVEHRCYGDSERSPLDVVPASVLRYVVENNTVTQRDPCGRTKQSVMAVWAVPWAWCCVSTLVPTYGHPVDLTRGQALWGVASQDHRLALIHLDGLELLLRELGDNWKGKAGDIQQHLKYLGLL